MKYALLLLLLCACYPPRSADYATALRACDTSQSEEEWRVCCVDTARLYSRDPNFCLEPL